MDRAGSLGALRYILLIEYVVSLQYNKYEAIVCGPYPVARTHPASRTGIQEGLMLAKLLWFRALSYTTAYRACSEQQKPGQTHGHSSKGNSVLK